eukprot:CAMPEP_0202694642 /NCGR_PEP_ID=MMETSP1385-20130828/8453_1 /ASSEMBLY_ACC=CAM_ASM_000861 /TAXON_ID=933848 /ORGANISM="Elphidium margaritaceum" /LENGTH=134 /DNA_ID=CAMNT_0049350525 /DNA_START=30 /DNA_END=431 /DNA_ORIENTATION=+
MVASADDIDYQKAVESLSASDQATLKSLEAAFESSYEAMAVYEEKRKQSVPWLPRDQGLEDAWHAAKKKLEAFERSHPAVGDLEIGPLRRIEKKVIARIKEARRSRAPKAVQKYDKLVREIKALKSTIASDPEK